VKQIINFIDRVENFTLVWTILGLALIGFVQVLTRYIFNYSFTWFEELGRYLGVFIAFLGASLRRLHGGKNREPFHHGPSGFQAEQALAGANTVIDQRSLHPLFFYRGLLFV